MLIKINKYFVFRERRKEHESIQSRIMRGLARKLIFEIKKAKSEKVKLR